MTGNGRDADVIVRSEGAVGRITLNRPQALNALTLDMVRAVDAALTAWDADRAVASVVLDGAGDRGFCAGGDIRGLYEAAKSGDSLPRTFWREEYHLNARIARYPKPVVAIMDGIVMGGGVGLSGHASHRVATERLMIAMPEVGIGFAPDVGGTFLLSRAPGETGTHLALTGDRLGAADAIYCGLADVAIDSAAVSSLLDRLQAGDVDAALDEVRLRSADGEARMQAARVWIDECYSADMVETILERLRARPEPAANDAATALETKSPTSLKTTLRALRAARDLPTLEACLDQEFRVSCGLLESPDFVEGVRATIIDKDGQPAWQPSLLAEVSHAQIDRYFASLGSDELGLAR